MAIACRTDSKSTRPSPVPLHFPSPNLEELTSSRTGFTMTSSLRSVRNVEQSMLAALLAVTEQRPDDLDLEVPLISDFFSRFPEISENSVTLPQLRQIK